MEKRYKLGIIGFGVIACMHRETIMNCDERIDLKGAFDIAEAPMKVIEELGMHPYSSREELLSDPEIDIVLCSATNEVHKEICIDALRHGKHVICEKPVTMSSAELEEIMAVAKETGKVFTIDQNRRTNKDFVLMKRNVESGILGDVYLIESRVEGSRGMPKGWRTLKDLGGGMMYDWGVHLIDQLMYMNKSKVVNVFCRFFNVDYKEVDDNFNLILTFEDGLVAHIDVSTNSYITHPRWMAFGSEGTLQIDDWNCDGKIVRVLDKQSEWDEQVVYTKAGPTRTMAPRRPDSVETITLSEPLDVEDGMQVVYRQLVNAIEGGELTIKPEQALRVMKVMEAAFKSAQENIAVQTSI